MVPCFYNQNRRKTAMKAYPKASHFLTYRDVGSGNVLITEHILTEEQYLVRKEYADFLQKLDGQTDPASLLPNLSKRELRDVLQELSDASLLLESRLPFCFPLIKCSPEIRSHPLCRILNTVLLLLFFPVFLCGAAAFFHYRSDIFFTVPAYLGGFFFGLTAGATLHECGHAIAGLACGCPVFEAGLHLHPLMPGAYVIWDCKGVGRFQGAQACAAGIEMNLLLSGASFLAFSYLPQHGSFWVGCAACNFFLALFNLGLTKDLDGMAILSELLGFHQQLYEKAASCIQNRRKCIRLLCRGRSGRIQLAAYGLLILLQVNAVLGAILNLLVVFDLIL